MASSRCGIWISPSYLLPDPDREKDRCILYIYAVIQSSTVNADDQDWDSNQREGFVRYHEAVGYNGISLSRMKPQPAKVKPQYGGIKKLFFILEKRNRWRQKSRIVALWKCTCTCYNFARFELAAKLKHCACEITLTTHSWDNFLYDGDLDSRGHISAQQTHLC